MSREEEFKKSLSEILDPKEFAFDEANWAGALDLINARKKRRRAAFILFPLLGIMIGGLATLLMLSGESTSGQNKQVVSERASASEITEANKAPQTTATPEIKAPRPLTQQPANEPLTQAALPYKVPDPAHLPHEHNQPATDSPNSSDATANNDVVKNNLPQKDNHNNGMDDNSSSQKQEDTHNIRSGNIVSNSKSDDNHVETVPGNPTTVNDAPPVPDNAPKGGEDTTPNAVIASVEPLTAAQNTPDVIAPVKQGPETIPAAKAPATDSIKALPKPQAPDPVNYLTLEAGSSYNLGWKNPAAREAAGFTPVFGLHFATQLTRKVSFSFGAQYNSVRNLSFCSKESKVTRYGLGEESKVTVITPATLYYLNFPLKVMYDLNAKNKVGAGYNIAYLFNVQSKVETYNVYPTYTDNYQSYYTAGYTEGIGIFNSQAALIYRRQLWRDLWCNTELFVGLSDVKNNVFFNVNKAERVSGIKVTFMYHLFKK